MKKFFILTFSIFFIMIFNINVFATNPLIDISHWESEDKYGISVNYDESKAERIYLSDEKFTMLMVNGDFISDADALISNGRTLVPLRVISEKLGADIKWNSDERSVDIWQNENNIKMYIDSNNIYLNGEALYTEVPPQIINSITYVPLRIIGEALNAEVGYYDGLYSPLVWVFNKTEEIKVSESEALKIAEDIYFNKFLPTIADEAGIILNTNININEVTPDNFSEKMPGWLSTYNIKCVSDFGEYYLISYFDSDIDGGNEILIDKYDGSYYPVSGFSNGFLHITKNDDFGSWGFAYQ